MYSYSMFSVSRNTDGEHALKWRLDVEYDNPTGLSGVETMENGLSFSQAQDRVDTCRAIKKLLPQADDRAIAKFVIEQHPLI